MMQRRAEMMWTQLFLLILAGMLLLVTLKPIATSIIQMTDVTSPTEESFSQLNQEIEDLLAKDSPFYYKKTVPISIEEDYLLIGFDANYTQPRDAWNFFSKELYKGYSDPYGPHAYGHNTQKPPQCDNGSACLCLHEMRHTDYGAYIDCHSFGEDVIIAGFPYVTPHEDAGSWTFETWQFLANDEHDYQFPVQNVGMPRRKDGANGDILKKMERNGYGEEWYKWYGYLVLPGYITYPGSNTVYWKARNVYIEKIEDMGKTIVLIIPESPDQTEDEDSAYSKPTMGSEVVEKRTQLLQEQYERIKNTINDSVNELNETLADSRDPAALQQLLSNCSRYRRLFETMPSPCGRYDCETPQGNCSAKETPCICHEVPHAQVCTEQKSLCYTTGCTSAKRTDGYCG